jgi:hypothetical protein
LKRVLFEKDFIFRQGRRNAKEPSLKKTGRLFFQKELQKKAKLPSSF